MTRDVWIVRRCGRGYFGSVTTVEPLSVLAAAGFRLERGRDGLLWWTR